MACAQANSPYCFVQVSLVHMQTDVPAATHTWSHRTMTTSSVRRSFRLFAHASRHRVPHAPYICFLPMSICQLHSGKFTSRVQMSLISPISIHPLRGWDTGQ